MKAAAKDGELRRIRNRASYRLFQELYEFLSMKPSVADILRKIHDILDAKWSFGSERNAGYAVESLEWVLRDNRTVAGEDCPGEKHKKASPFGYPGDEDGNHT